MNETPPCSISCFKGVLTLAEYDIDCQGVTVGRAIVLKEGLYYRFSCLCKPPTKQHYDIWVSIKGKRTKLGLCIPDANGFRLERKLPIKQFDEGDMYFFLIARMKGEEIKRIPVVENREYEYLEFLADSHLKIADGQLFVEFQLSKEISSPTGQ